MKKIISIVVLFMCLFIVSGCSDNKLSEKELIEEGLSLDESLKSFVNLSDNYAYKYKIHQTNGEDWFYYRLVKLYNKNIYIQDASYNFNAGWKYEEESFKTNFNGAYYIYKYVNNNYEIYRKFKYEDTDEEYTKYSYLNYEENNLSSKEYLPDFSMIKDDDFEFVDNSSYEGVDKFWKLNDNKIMDYEYARNLISGINFDLIENKDRLDGLYIYVEDNKVIKLKYMFYKYDLNMSYNIYIEPIYDDYTFDIDTLTSGFVEYNAYN